MVKAKTLFFFIVVFLNSSILYLASCGDEQVKPSASGKNGEILVVIDSSVWKSSSGKLLRDSLMVAFPGLPQHEPLFRLINVDHANFKNILKLHRNVLIIVLNEKVENSNYTLKENEQVWAKGQMVLQIEAIDNSWLDAAILNFTPVIREKYNMINRQRLIQGFEKLSSPKINTKLEENFKINIPITRDFYIAKLNNDYCWIRRETEHVSLGLQLYYIPHVSDSSFTINHIINLRDSVSKQNIPGPSKGSYMVTEKRYPLSSEVTTISGNYSVVIKGLWKTEGDFMGGPFSTYGIYNEELKKILIIDAFIYSPKLKKSTYVRQLDAIVHAIKFI